MNEKLADAFHTFCGDYGDFMVNFTLYVADPNDPATAADAKTEALAMKAAACELVDLLCEQIG